MKNLLHSLPWIYFVLYLTAHVITTAFTAHACMFPDYLQSREGHEECSWHTRIRKDKTRETCYAIRHNVLELRHAASSSRQTTRWKCSLTFHGKFLLKRTDPTTLEERSACVKFLRRSPSIVQVMWSEELRRLDPALCEDRNLDLDPWPLVNLGLVMKDYTPSPFRGGFSMRITNSEHGENGCNYMHRPMKFESDCLTGEGVLFDFISETCIPDSESGASAMFVKQRTLPVASWMEKGDHYVILRRRDETELYCLRMPSTSDNHMNAFLFTDLACLTENVRDLLKVPSPERGGEVRYLILHLIRYVYRHLCDDEYPQCSAVTCNSYNRHECHKSCNVCDASEPPPTCSFPRRLRGHWYQADVNGLNQVNVSETELRVGNMGHFRCVVFPDSPTRRTRMYTTVSKFKNGCRPRYTCVKFKRLGPSVLKYALSRSYVWPDLEENFGKSICASAQFGMDPEPVNDLYRSHEDTGKPIISYEPAAVRVPCNLSSSFTITASFPNGSLCHGSLYQHCGDNSRLRLHFHAGGCGQALRQGEELGPEHYVSEEQSPTSLPGPWSADYSCLAHYEGHYWERVLMLQNEAEAGDARCLLLTHLDATEALMMVAGQCDKNSWNYARAGLRVPLLTLRLRPDEFPCKYPPVTTTTTSSSSTTVSGHGGGGHQGKKHHQNDKHNHRKQHHRQQQQQQHQQNNPTPRHSLSFTVTFPPPRDGSKQRISAAYEEPQGGRGGTHVDPDELSPTGNEHGSSSSTSGGALAGGGGGGGGGGSGGGGGVSSMVLAWGRIVLAPSLVLFLGAALPDWITR